MHAQWSGLIRCRYRSVEVYKYWELLNLSLQKKDWNIMNKTTTPCEKEMRCGNGRAFDGIQYDKTFLH